MDNNQREIVRIDLWSPDDHSNMLSFGRSSWITISRGSFDPIDLVGKTLMKSIATVMIDPLRYPSIKVDP